MHVYPKNYYLMLASYPHPGLKGLQRTHGFHEQGQVTKAGKAPTVLRFHLHVVGQRSVSACTPPVSSSATVALMIHETPHSHGMCEGDSGLCQL